MVTSDDALGIREANDPLAQIVAAARDCFAHLGVHRTRMEDVEAAAGTVRTSLYRRVSSREELVELEWLERCREFSAELRNGTNYDAEDLRKELVELVIWAIAMGRGDEEFTYLLQALPRPFASFLTGLGSPMHQIVFDTFAQLIERDRERGVIREDASEHDIVEWIQGIVTLFVPRDDLSAVEERRRIRTFPVPAVFAR